MQYEQYEAIIFDFDGTLATLTIDFGLMRRKVGALAAAYLEDDVPDVGEPVLEWLEVLKGRVEQAEGLDVAMEFHTRCRFAIIEMEVAAAREGELFGFTRPMLSWLRGRGVRTGIVTRNCTPAVRTVFADVDEYVDVLLAREDAERVKPDPAHLLAACARLGVEPGRALMIGDHPMDVVAGHRAGMHAAAVYSGRYDAVAFARELGDVIPELTGADCAEVLGFSGDMG